MGYEGWSCWSSTLLIKIGSVVWCLRLRLKGDWGLVSNMGKRNTLELRLEVSGVVAFLDQNLLDICVGYKGEKLPLYTQFLMPDAYL